MGEIIRIGIDTSKYVFQVHGVNAAEQPVLRKTLRRGQMEAFFTSMPPTLIGLEACGAAHHWARVLQALGHEVRLLPPQYVKPYVKRGKNDAADAEAICEAMSRPSMRFVPVRSKDNQADLMVLTARDLLVKQKTMLINAIRAHAAEFGVTGRKGADSIAALRKLILTHEELPELARDILAGLLAQVASLEQQIRALKKKIVAWHRSNQCSRRMATIPGVGPIGAAALVMKVPDPRIFKSARHFAAWLGLTPKDHSTAGRRRLGVITRAGDEMLRRLLVNGAMAVVKYAKPGRASPWLLNLLARKPKKLAAVALANKIARIAWVLMMRGEVFRRSLSA
jgi:transposase